MKITAVIVLLFISMQASSDWRSDQQTRSLQNIERSLKRIDKSTRRIERSTRQPKSEYELALDYCQSNMNSFAYDVCMQNEMDRMNRQTSTKMCPKGYVANWRAYLNCK